LDGIQEHFTIPVINPKKAFTAEYAEKHRVNQMVIARQYFTIVEK